MFRTPVSSERKSDRTPVTEADRAAEEAMRRLIKSEFPRDAIHGEEFGAETGTSGRTWVLDPIDGTTAFMAGRPIFGTLIALVVEGWPVLGVIDQAILDERWLGVTGQPTTLNGQPVRTRPCRELADAALATTGPHYFDDHDGEHFMGACREIRSQAHGDGRRLLQLRDAGVWPSRRGVRSQSQIA